MSLLLRPEDLCNLLAALARRRQVHKSFGPRTTRASDDKDCGCRLVGRRHAAVFFQPLQFFADFDFSVPGILAKAVAFAGEDQEFIGDA